MFTNSVIDFKGERNPRLDVCLF